MVPSPNQAPAVRPVKLVVLPSRDTMPIRASPVTTPDQDRLARRIGPFGNACARHLDLAGIELARPDRDPPQVIFSDHARTEGIPNPAPSYCTATMLSKFAGELSNTRHSRLSLYPIEDQRGGSRAAAKNINGRMAWTKRPI